MLIRDAEVAGRRLDVRCSEGCIREIGADLAPHAGERTFEAEGGALLPGLHDHHLHLRALAASLDSIPCGPPRVHTREELERTLRRARPARDGWLRGVGYHESVAGALERRAIDALRDDCAIRIQHRSGAMWLLNSRAVQALALDADVSHPTPDGVERDGAGRATGRLFRLDAWLRTWLPPRHEPALEPVGEELARSGVTGVTDATPGNDGLERNRLREAQRRGALPQRLVLMGGLDLEPYTDSAWLTIGAHKILLDEPALPALDDLVARIRAAHDARRPVAIHTVTRTELLFALAALEASGSRSGDRLEHASIAPDEVLQRVARLGLAIVTQPNFVLERGDAYHRDVEPRDRPFLYRLQSWLKAGVPLGGGTDAPFGAPDPWRAMRAAVERLTERGVPLGPAERIAPEAALALFTARPTTPGGAPRRIAIAEPADLCLLDRPWLQARETLGRDSVRATFVAGELVYDRLATSPTKAQLDPPICR